MHKLPFGAVIIPVHKLADRINNC